MRSLTARLDVTYNIGKGRMNKEQEDILNLFIEYGIDASFHHAADSVGDMGLAYKFQAECQRMYDNHPELHEQMVELAAKFLWDLKV